MEGAPGQGRAEQATAERQVDAETSCCGETSCTYREVVVSDINGHIMQRNAMIVRVVAKYSVPDL